MMKSLSLLLSIWSCLFCRAHGSTYSPAAGSFTCSEAGAFCMVSGCKVGFACNIVYNGFVKAGTDPQGRVVYTATREGANLSIQTDDQYATEILCESSCTCQAHDDSGIGCALRDADAPVVAAMELEETTTTAQETEGDNGETNNQNNILWWIVGVSVGVFLLLLVLGAIWYTHRRQQRKQDEPLPGGDELDKGEGSIDENDVYLVESVVTTNTEGEAEMEAMERDIETQLKVDPQ